MEFKAKDIAVLLKGVVEGDGEVLVNNVSKSKKEGLIRWLFWLILNMNIIFIRRKRRLFW